MAGGGVHFDNYKQVLEIFRNKKLQYFILCDRGNLLEKNDGGSNLTFEQAEQVLEDLFEVLTLEGQRISSAVHQLRLYETLPQGGRLTLKTDFDFSYSFKLNAAQENNGVGFYGQSQMQKLLSNQEEIIKNQKEILEGDNAPDTEDYGLGKIGKVMNHPRIAPAVELILTRIAENIFPGSTAAAQPGAISGIPDTATEQDKVNKAIEILQRYTPNFGDTLLKLADIAQNKPQEYKYLLTLLNAK